VLIVGGPDDLHAATVARGLAARGVPAEHLDFADFPARAELTWDPLARRGALERPGRPPVALERLRSVYWRTATRTRAAHGLQRDAHAFAEDESRRALECMLRSLACPVINSPAAVAAHRLKPLQTTQVAALGVPTPATLITSSPAALRAFVAAQTSGVIVKPVGGGAYVRKLVPSDLERDASIRACPMQYQAYIPGEDLRVYVIGERVFAARVITADPSRVDFRTDPTHHSVAFTLGRDGEQRCLQIARTLGLAFTGIDLRHTSANELVFLEANPSPMFLRFAADTGHPLAQALIDLLLVDPGAERAA